MSILDEDFLDSLESLFPVSINHMDFGLFEQSWEEILVLDCNLAKNLKSEVIFLSFFKDLSLTEHRLKMLWLSWLVFLKRLLEVLKGLELELLLWSGQIDPSLETH